MGGRAPRRRALSRTAPGAASSPDTKGGTAWLAGTSALVFLALLCFSSYAVALPLIRDSWGLTNAEAALLFSVYLFGLAAASLVVLPLIDRFPPERFLLAGVLLLTLSHLAFPLFARGFASAAALRLVAGVGHVSLYFPGIVLVSRRYPGSRRGSAVAAFVSAGYLGTTLSYTVTGALLARLGSWREAYLVTALASCLALPLAWLVSRRSGSRPEATGGGRISLRPLRERPLVLVLVAYALHSAELYLARLWLPLLLVALLVRRGAAPDAAASTAGAIAGLLFATGVAGVLLGGVLSDRVGRTGAAIGIFAASGACSFAMGWLLSSPLWIAVALGALYGFFTAADASIYSTALTELSPVELLGSTLALQSFAGFLAGALAPVVGGLVLDRTPGEGGWVLTFGLNGLLAVAGVGVLLALRRGPRARRMALGKR